MEEIDENTSIEDLQKMMAVALVYRVLVCVYEVSHASGRVMVLSSNGHMRMVRMQICFSWEVALIVIHRQQSVFKTNVELIKSVGDF